MKTLWKYSAVAKEIMTCIYDRHNAVAVLHGLMKVKEEEFVKVASKLEKKEREMELCSRHRLGFI